MLFDDDVDTVDRLPLEDWEDDRTKKFRFIKVEYLEVSESPFGLKEANMAVERMVDMVLCFQSCELGM